MKKLLALMLMVCVAIFLLNIPVHTQKEHTAMYGKCPATKMVGTITECLECHVKGSSAVKETDPDALRDYPTPAMRVRGDTGYLLLEAIYSATVDHFLDYLTTHSIDHAVIEIQSPGGSLVEAWRIVGLMRDWRDRKPNRIMETRIYGFAASAGFLVAISGDKGYRYASRTALLMWHELWSFKMFSIDTPSSSEEESKTLRFLQDVGDDWVASRSKLSKEELDRRVRNKQFWCTGKTAIDAYGFMDKLLAPNDLYPLFKHKKG